MVRYCWLFLGLLQILHIGTTLTGGFLLLHTRTKLFRFDQILLYNFWSVVCWLMFNIKRFLLLKFPRIVLNISLIGGNLRNMWVKLQLSSYQHTGRIRSLTLQFLADRLLVTINWSFNSIFLPFLFLRKLSSSLVLSRFLLLGRDIKLLLCLLHKVCLCLFRNKNTVTNCFNRHLGCQSLVIDDRIILFDFKLLDV